MAEGIGDLSVALAPEDVLERLAHLSASIECPLPDGVGVIGREVQDGCGAADAERRENTHLRELVGKHHHGVAEPELDLHELAAGHLEAPALLGAEDGSIPVGCARSIADDDVWRDGVHRRHLARRIARS